MTPKKEEGLETVEVSCSESSISARGAHGSSDATEEVLPREVRSAAVRAASSSIAGSIVDDGNRKDDGDKVDRLPAASGSHGRDDSSVSSSTHVISAVAERHV